MDSELKRAISVIEDAGGFVMLPESDQQEREVRQLTHDMHEQKLKELEQADLDNENDFQKRKKEAFREMNREFYKDKGPSLTTMSDLEDILLDNGVDLDYLEEWIESQI